jgi:hypothetical protein
MWHSRKRTCSGRLLRRCLPVRGASNSCSGIFCIISEPNMSRLAFCALLWAFSMCNLPDRNVFLQRRPLWGELGMTQLRRPTILSLHQIRSKQMVLWDPWMDGMDQSLHIFMLKTTGIYMRQGVYPGSLLRASMWGKWGCKFLGFALHGRRNILLAGFLLMGHWGLSLQVGQRGKIWRRQWFVSHYWGLW